jgi:hypothetical protein
MATHANPILGDPNKSPSGFPGSTVTSPSIYASGGRIDMGGNYNAFNPAMVGMTSGGSSGNAGTTVIVNAGTIATPDELVILIKTAIQDLNRAGDSTTFAGAIA